MPLELIDSRNIYTTRLKTVLVDHVWDGINSLYTHSRELNGPWMISFQTCLRDVKDWNREKINKAASDIESIVNESAGSEDFLKKLITTIIVLNVKVLSSASSLRQNDSKIVLNVPTIADFIYDVYQLVAKKVYPNPKLFDDKNVDVKTMYQNVETVYKMIGDSVEEVINSALPYNSLLSQYLESMNEPFVDDALTVTTPPPQIPHLDEEKQLEESDQGDDDGDDDDDVSENVEKKINLSGIGGEKHHHNLLELKSDAGSDSDSNDDE